MTTETPGHPPYGVPPQPPKRGLGTGPIIAIVVIGVLVVAGIAVGAFALFGSGGSQGDVDGKYAAEPLPTCDDVASRAGDLPPKSSDTKLEGSAGWLCTFTDAAAGTSVHLDLEISTVARQHTAFDTVASTGAYELDPTLQLGEKAAWGLAPSGQMCELVVLDSNAQFKVGVGNPNAARSDTRTCEDRATAIARGLYDAIQTR
ncbi:hypothetical protein H4696_009743 [Amycolatopsis lexingtonensis]|uniref:DUF3558 domain-containing protein n=1 Tax=Amycolatopsis lexingtonensis TaxID=218822 RepID=A0ABR9IHI1_9PSEU|nr:hypothetical protein [Amycolatopsis lexingtonensis]MBE1502643.1 hypothetical protein [Amycolatopsis lexingtonensis]